MKLRMLKTAKGARDGHTVETFVEGQEYDIGGDARADDLAAVFVRERWAVEVGVSPLKAIADAIKSGTFVGTPPVDQRPVRRLPLVEEYVAAGYDAANYASFIEGGTAAAAEAGFRVEVRARTPAELAEAKAADAEHQKQLEAERAKLAAEKAADEAKAAAELKAKQDAEAAKASEKPADAPAATEAPKDEKPKSSEPKKKRH